MRLLVRLLVPPRGRILDRFGEVLATSRLNYRVVLVREQAPNVEATLDARVAFLLNDYDYFLTMPDFLLQRLDGIKSLHSRETFARWHELVRSADWPTLVRELLEQHYDALYRRSQNQNFTGYRHPEAFSTDDLSTDGMAELATRLVHSRTAQIA